MFIIVYLVVVPGVIQAGGERYPVSLNDHYPV